MLEPKSSKCSSDASRVFAVIVLYKMQPSESATYKTLQAAIACLPEGQADISVLLYDNTPGGQDPGLLPANVQYKADLGNSGLAKAYNYALQLAHENGYEWLLTLDQDTNLPIEFLRNLCHTATFVEHLNTVGAIVPCLHDEGRVISPFMLRKPWALLKPFPDEFIGVSLEEATAANSAAAIRVSALQAIGGYDPRFNFDASDWVMFHRLQINNFSVFVAGNIRVEHELSIYDLEHRSTPERYGHMLCVEEAYYHEYGERVEGAVILLKLFYRLIYKIWATGGGLPYFRVCLRFLFRRLFCSRKYRMESWNESVRRNSAA